MKTAKTNLTFTFISLFIIQVMFGQSRPIFRIIQNDSVGYINESGDMIISPVFLNGGEFSEGLASVRKNGLYGFIDSTGSFAIKPEYDYAIDFINGITAVYKNGQPYFIDRSGKMILPKGCHSFVFIDKRKGIIMTQTNKKGVFDFISQKLLIDTVFSTLSDFQNGVAVVHEYISPGKKKKEKKVGVIDSTGKFIVRYGKYEKIGHFYDGYAVVEMDRKRSSSKGVIDTKGALVSKISEKNNCYLPGDFHEGYAKMNLYKYWIPEESRRTTEKVYGGYINLKGEVVLNDTNYRHVNDFSNGRAFVENDNGDYILIDKNFKRIGNRTFQNILNETFKDGYAIVETDDGFGIIDTSGNFIVSPQYEEIDRVGIVDGYFFFKTDNDDNEGLFGISDLSGKVVLEPIMREFDRRGFVNGLIQGIIDNKLTYISKAGKIIWQQPTDTIEALKRLNIDFMNRGYFYAYSTPKISEGDESGGWATSPNKPCKISELGFPNDILSVTIDTTILDTFAIKFYGYRLFISNTTKDTFKFNAQDSRLYMKLQAQNDLGEWKDIEYLPRSWCGNSYHKIELEPNSYWSFTIPDYQGEFKVKIRAELKYIDIVNPKEQKTVYSNIINGSINPGQLWNKREYYPSGLMDPYYD